MRKRLFLSIAIFLLLVVIISQIVQMANASNPMFSTQIQSPTNTSYSTGLINLETITVCLSGSNIYYTTTYSLDGKENITIPLTAEPHEKSFQTTMKGLATLPLLSAGSHSVTVYQKVEAKSTPPEVYHESYTISFSVSQQIQSNPSISLSPTPRQTPASNSLSSPIVRTAIASMIIILTVASISLVFFKRRKSKTA